MVDVNISITDLGSPQNAWRCTLTGGSGSISLDLDYNDAAPYVTGLRFFLLLDWQGENKGIRLGMYRNPIESILSSETVNGLFPPGTRKFNFGITSGSGSRNYIHIMGRENQNMIGAKRGCIWIHRFSGNDNENWVHTVYRDINTPVSLNPPASEYIEGWALAGKIAPVTENINKIVVTLNNYQPSPYDVFRQRMAVEWFSGTDVEKYGFKACKLGPQFVNSSDIKYCFGIERKNISETTVSVRFHDPISNNYESAVSIFQGQGYIYFYSPDPELSTLRLYNYQPFNPWGSGATRVGPDLEILRNSNNPPSDTNSNEVSVITVGPPVAYNAY